jgi:hypothetical protein
LKNQPGTARDGFGTEGGDTNRHHRSVFSEVLAQRVVERASLFGLADHRCLLSIGGVVPGAGSPPQSRISRLGRARLMKVV